MSSKIQNLIATTTLASTDVTVFVTDPAGVPADNKITLANLKTSLGLTGTNSGDQTISDATITTTDITTNNFTTLKHGFVPKGTNVGSFLKDDGTWAAITASGNALTSNPLSQFAATTSLQLSGVISDETGTGALVFATSPTLVTPALGTPTALVGTNISGTAASLTAGNATQSSALKSATTTVNVDASTAPTTGQVLTATGGTAATWQTPAAGGSSSPIPSIIYPFGGGASPSDEVDVSNSTGAYTYANTPGSGHSSIANGASSTSLGQVICNAQAGSFSSYDRTATMGTFIELTNITTGNACYFITLGGSGYPSATGVLTVVHIGFMHVVTAGVGVTYASSADGTTQTKTVITTISGRVCLAIVFTPGVNSKYYLNGTLVATITTNLPSGSSGKAWTYGVINASGDTTSRTFYNYGSTVAFNAI